MPGMLRAAEALSNGSLLRRPCVGAVAPSAFGAFGSCSVNSVNYMNSVNYTATRRTLSPQSFVMSSMSEVSMTTGRR